MIETLIPRINTCARRLEELIATREPHHEFTAPDTGYVLTRLRSNRSSSDLSRIALAAKARGWRLEGRRMDVTSA
jgi:hypothetical protein